MENGAVLVRRLKWKAAKRRYRARKKAAARLAQLGPDPVLPRDHFQVLKHLYGNKCVVCGQHERKVGALVAQPVDWDKPFTLHNAQPVCEACKQ